MRLSIRSVRVAIIVFAAVVGYIVVVVVVVIVVVIAIVAVIVDTQAGWKQSTGLGLVLG